MWQNIYQRIQPLAFWLLLIFHIIGLIGIGFINFSLFASLSALTLLLSLFLLFVDNEGPPREFWRLFLFCFVFGYLIELVGVQTGYPFGAYQYGPNLGPRLFGVPIIIGVNWFLLTLSSGFVVQHIFQSKWARALGAAALMVFVDAWIEPVADDLLFWRFGTEWEHPTYVPWTNYAAWFIVAYIMQRVFLKTVRLHINNLAVRYFFVVLAFFICLNLII